MLKRFVSILLMAVLFSVLIIPTASATENPIKVFVDGEQVYFSVNPVIENGTTLVQFRPIFEKLGLQVNWNDETRTVTGVKDKLNLELQIGNNTAKINGNSANLEVEPKLIDGNTFVPLRFIGEAIGKEVKWYGESRTIQIGKQIVLTENTLFNLSDSKIQDAIKIGEKGLESLLKYKNNNKLSIKEDNNLGSWKPDIWVSTPLIQVARDSYLKNRNYKKYTIEDAKATISKVDALTFELWTYGDQIDFGKSMNVVLKQGDKIIQPKEIIGKDELGETTSSWPKSPAYHKIVLVDFDKSEIDFNSEYELIYLYAGKELSATYKVNFSTLK